VDEQTRRQITWVIIIGLALALVVVVGQRRTEVRRMVATLATGSPGERVEAVRTLVARQKLPEALEDQPRWVQDNAVAAVALVGTNRAMTQLIASIHLLDAPVADRASAYLVCEAERSIGPLVEAMQDKDADVRAATVAPLTKIGEPVIPSLLELVDAWDDYVRDGVVGVFAGIGAPVTTKCITIMKKTQPGPDQSDAAFLRGKDTAQRALEAMRVPAMAPIVQELLTSDEPELRGTACAMLGVIVDQSVETPIAPEDAHEAVAPLLQHLTTDPAWAVRRKAATALGKLQALGRDEPGVVSTLVAHLGPGTERRPEVRAAAAEALGKIKAVEAAGPLVHLLMTARQGATQEIATALERLGPGAIPSLLSALNSPDAEVRRVATETLAEIGTTEAAVPLASQLADPEAAIRRVAANALKGIATPQVVPQLVRALEDSDWQVYHAASEALSGVGRPAVPHLVAMLAPENPRVNRMASLALQRIGRAAIPDLVAALRSENAHTRQWAAIALGSIGGDVVEPVTRLLQDEAAPLSNRTAAAAALGRTHMSSAIEPLIKAAGSPHPALQVAALGALNEVGADEATESLVAALSAPSEYVREVAMELLRDWRRGEVNKLLQEVVTSGSLDSQRRAAIILAYQASPAANILLSQVLSSPVGKEAATLDDLRPILESAVQDASVSPELRHQAIISLGYIGQEQSLSVLEPFLAADNPFLASAGRAVAMIGKAAHERHQQLLLKQRGRGEVVAPEAVGRAARMLLNVFKDATDKQLRLQAAAALSLMGAQPVEMLIESLSTAPDQLKPWIAAILGAIGKPASEPLMEARGEADDDPELQAWCAAALQLVGDAQALEILAALPEEQQPNPEKVEAGQEILDKMRAAQ